MFIDDDAFDSFFDWTCDNKAIAKKIKKLITDIEREPYDGMGKPEPLKYGLSGYWSRRINEEHRLTYKVENDTIVILSCKGHYE
jgi:toxin YoeB